MQNSKCRIQNAEFKIQNYSNDPNASNDPNLFLSNLRWL